MSKKQYAPKLTQKKSTAGTAWYLDFKDSTGKRKTKKTHDGFCNCVKPLKCDHYQAAVAVFNDFISKKEVEAETGYIDKKIEEYFVRYIDDCKASGKSQKTINIIQHTIDHLLPFCKEQNIKYLSELNFNNLIKFRNIISKKLAPATHNMLLRNVNTMLNYALKLNYLKSNPMTGNMSSHFKMATDKRYQYFTEQDINWIYNFFPDGLIKDITIFALLTGMRISEITNLKYSDVKDNYIFLSSQDTYKTKSKKNRSIPIHARVYEILAKYRTNNQSDFVFRNRYGNQLDSLAVSKAFKKMAYETGLKGQYPDKSYSFHTLRHTFCTVLINKHKVPLHVVQHLAGHSDIKTTILYVSYAPDDLVSAINQL